MNNYFSYMQKALANPNVKIRMSTEVEQRQRERRDRARYLNSCLSIDATTSQSCQTNDEATIAMERIEGMFWFSECLNLGHKQ